MPATPRISAVERERLERMAQAQRAQLAVSQPPRSSNPAAAALQSPAAARMRHGAASISDSPLPPSPPPLRVVPSPRRPAVNGRLSNAANAAALLDGDNITDPIQFAMRAYQAGAVMPAAAAAAAPSVVVPKQKIAVASVAVGAPAPVAAGNQSSQSYFLAACAALVIAAIVASFLGTNSSGSLSAHSHTGAANSASSTTAAAHLRMTMAEFAARQTEWQTQLDAAASAAESALTAVPEFASCAQPVSAASSPSAAAAAASSEQEDEIQMCPPLSALNAELTWSNWLQRKSAEQASASAASAPSSTDSPTVELQASSTKPAVDALEAARTALQLAEQVRASMTAAQTDMSAAETKVKARARQTMRVASLRVDFYRTHRMLASSAARASAALRNLTAADSALDMQRSALAAFSVEHADSVSARRARLDTLAQCRRAVADATDRATQAQQRADAIDVQRQQHATSDAMARAELQRHRSKAAAAETDAKAAVDEAAAIEDGLVALAAAVETAREKQAHIHSLLNMLDDIAGTGAAGDGSAKAVSQLAEMDAQIAAKRAEVQRANEKISQNERSQQKHDQQKALHERKLAKGASGSGEPSAEDPVLRNFQKLIAGKRVALQTAVDEAERSLARLLDVRQSMAADDRMAQDSAALRATLDANLTAASGEFAAAHTAHAVAQSRLTVVAQRQSSARAALADAQSAIAQTTARIEAIEAETRRHERDAAAIAASQTEADAALAAAVAAEQRAAVDAREFDADVSEYDELVRQRQREIASAALHGETLRKAAFDVLFDAGQRRHFEALRQLQQQVTSSVTEHAALGRDVDAAWSRAQQSQARVAEATKLLKAA